MAMDFSLDGIPDVLKILIAVLGGGGGMKAFEILANRSESRIGGDAAIRKDLMQQAEDLRNYVDQLRDELRVWTDKYYDTLGEKLSLEAGYRTLESNYAQVRERNAELISEVEELNQKLARASAQLHQALSRLRELQGSSRRGP